LITTTAQSGAAGNLLDISLAGMPGMMDPAVYGNKIPPALQKNYIHAVYNTTNQQKERNPAKGPPNI